jgi:hypothetical protein
VYVTVGGKVKWWILIEREWHGRNGTWEKQRGVCYMIGQRSGGLGTVLRLFCSYS